MHTVGAPAPRSSGEPCSGCKPRPPATATVKVRASPPGPLRSKRTEVPSGHAACFGDHEAHGSLDPLDRHGRRTAAAPPGTVETEPGVLLVHPAVEHAHLHEHGVRALPDRAPSHFCPFRLGERVQLGEPPGGHVEELGVHLGTGTGAPDGHPGLVGRGEVVLHVGTELALPRRCGLAHDGALDPDQVRQLVLDVPARALRRESPFGRRELTAGFGQGTPRLGQGVACGQPQLLPAAVRTGTPGPHAGHSALSALSAVACRSIRHRSTVALGAPPTPGAGGPASGGPR